MGKKRYAVCGVSYRGIAMYIKPMVNQFAHCAELTGILDIDPLRFQICKELVPETKDVSAYLADDFENVYNINRKRW